MWVRPILMMSSHSFDFAAIASRRAVTAGTSRSFTFTAAAMYMAEGKESFEDWAMLTWSLGWTGAWLPSGVPASWLQRLEITSFTFMLNWVPLPVIQTCSGNMSWCLPARISSQVWMINLCLVSSSRPLAWLAVAAAFFRIA